MSVTINGSTGVTTPGISNSEGYTGDGLTIAAGAPSGAVQVDTSGNIGLGVTPSAWSVGKAFEVGAAGNGIWGVNSASVYFTQNAYYNGGWKYANSSTATNYQQNGGQHIWQTAPSGTAGNAISFTQAMTLTAAGQHQTLTTNGTLMNAYDCRAWVNFNSTGTVAIRASGNVSSITDNGTGDYTVNFTTAMPDALFGVVATCNLYNNYQALTIGVQSQSVSTVQVRTGIGNAATAVEGTSAGGSTPVVNVAIFR